MNAEQKRQGEADAAAARADLYQTLSQLKVQLNYAKRVDDAVDEAKARLMAERQARPLAFAAGVVGVAVLAGTIAWGISAVVIKRFR